MRIFRKIALNSLVYAKLIKKKKSPVALWVDLPANYRRLHPLFHFFHLKLYIGPVPDAKPSVVFDGDAEDK